MKIKFIADTMLGDLARWLRMLGFDTLYSKDFRDDEIIKLAKKEGRIILTRDRLLHKKALKENIKSIWRSDSDTVSWLKRIKTEFNIKTLTFNPEATRCPICNTPLIRVLKFEVKGNVPDEVLNKYDKFWKCLKCGKVYWIGTHWITINDILKRVNEDYTSEG